MAKFDHKDSLPDIFKKNKLAILPTSRREYVISHFNAWHEIENPSQSCSIVQPLPEHIKSLHANSIRSETNAINYAYAAGIIHSFMGDDLVLPTVSGRMGSGEFDFTIQNKKTNSDQKISVRRAQIEIDAAYEGTESMLVIEAKNNINISDFIIRQLYYPYRCWQSRLNKTVRPVFMTYSNGVFTLREYKFKNPLHYNSLVLEKHMAYSLERTGIQEKDLRRITEKSKIVRDSEINFPQADRFERVINLCELLHQQEMSRDEVTDNYDFAPRQTNYYTDAAIYLGLVEKRTHQQTVSYHLTQLGHKILRANHRDRQLAYCKCILSHQVFNILMKNCLDSSSPPTKQEIVAIMKSNNISGVHSESTYQRRATTVKSWLDWMMGLIAE